MINFLKSNYKILTTALQNKEPVGHILKNAFRKVIGLPTYYIPSRKLSSEKGYNIYLNKRMDEYIGFIPETWLQELGATAKFNIVITNCKELSKIEEVTLRSIRRQAIKAKISFIENLNAEVKSDEWYLFLKNGDVLDLYALKEILELIEEQKNVELITFDHDKIEWGDRKNHRLKPNFNKTLLLNYNYIGYAHAFKGRILKSKEGKINTTNLFPICYEILLRTDATNIKHIPRPLLSKFSLKCDFQEKQTLIKYYQDQKGELVEGVAKESHQFQNELSSIPLISIIIPFRNKPELLKQVMTSLVDLTDYKNYEIILADNGSDTQATKEYIEILKSKYDFVQHVYIDIEFNFSEINNQAVKLANGELLLFLNNDIEVIYPGWLYQLVKYIEDPEVGVVGAKLLYPNKQVQHAGVVMGIGDVAGHIFRNLEDKDDGYLKKANCSQEIMAVTGACLLTKKDIFVTCSGFDSTNLAIAYNDIDYCMKVIDKGYKVIYNPMSKLIHHESQSRDFDMAKNQIKRYRMEVNHMVSTWKLENFQDPFYHPAMSRKSESYILNYE